MNTPPSRARVLSAPISWWHVIVDLERHGYTHRQIAIAIGGARSTVQDWKNLLVEPRHVDGEKLIALWCAVTGRDRADLPSKDVKPLSATTCR